MDSWSSCDAATNDRVPQLLDTPVFDDGAIYILGRDESNGVLGLRLLKLIPAVAAVEVVRDLPDPFTTSLTPAGITDGRIVWQYEDANAERGVISEDLLSGANRLEILTRPPDAFDIVRVDGGFIYWLGAAASRPIFRKPVNGGASETYIDFELSGVDAYALAQEAVYWREGSQLYLRARRGGGF